MRYIWYHPFFTKYTEGYLLESHQRNAIKHGYHILAENELYRVSFNDHLTLVGHSSSDAAGDKKDAGKYMHGELAHELAETLVTCGLTTAPKILSLECCEAGSDDGLAFDLSRLAFFKFVFIETCVAGIGRKPDKVKWNLKEDGYGRAIMGTGAGELPWRLLFNGIELARYQHDSYKVDASVQLFLDLDTWPTIRSAYQPGIFGGRIGRYMFFKDTETFSLNKLIQFAKQEPDSASAKAFEIYTQQELIQDGSTDNHSTASFETVVFTK
jgi:hypothetical protein